MITTNILSSEYKEGRRIDIVEHTYTIADDLIRLGQMYYNLGQKLNGASNEKEIAALQAMIDAQHEVIKGYGDTDAADASAE